MPTSPTCEVTTCHTHNLFAPKTFSDLCKRLDAVRLDINIFCLCVRVLQNLIKACSRRIRVFKQLRGADDASC